MPIPDSVLISYLDLLNSGYKKLFNNYQQNRFLWPSDPQIVELQTLLQRFSDGSASGYYDDIKGLILKLASYSFLFTACRSLSDFSKLQGRKFMAEFNARSHPQYSHLSDMFSGIAHIVKRLFVPYY